jgi:hypothetical protein
MVIQLQAILNPISTYRFASGKEYFQVQLRMFETSGTFKMLVIFYFG